MVALAVAWTPGPAINPTQAGEPGRCCLCGDFTQRSLCAICRIQYSTIDPLTGRLVCPDWLKAIQREAHRLDKRAHTMAARHQRLQTFSEWGIEVVAEDGLALVAEVTTPPEELPPAPALYEERGLVWYIQADWRSPFVTVGQLRRYRHGVPLDMHDFLALLDEVLGWPPLGTGYAPEHREQVLAVYERVYGL